MTAASKASQVVDDIHDVKEDYDKAKVKIKEDYGVVSDKAKEAVKNVDAKELGDRLTEGTKEVGGAAKKRMIEGIKNFGRKKDENSEKEQ